MQEMYESPIMPQEVYDAATTLKRYADQHNWTTGIICGLHIARTDLMLQGKIYLAGKEAGREELQEDLRELLGVRAENTEENP